ncbi:hypothetical protein [Pseudomonas syringae]|uniref:hypothetical protein n=1 Tax=Pseudomonas syringae TaxID=317 RepID=UPI0023F7019F|nr:hypothetical protein [Pseudomonas syringae]MDF7793105.1 hypothetical protein [Pseudomonas syringae]
MDIPLDETGNGSEQSSELIDYTVIDDFLEIAQCRELHKSLLTNQMWHKKNPISKHLYNSQPKSIAVEKVLAEVDGLMKSRSASSINLIDYWALLYSKNSDGNTHADFGQLTLTYWLTPEEYNLDLNTGGLIIYDIKRAKNIGASEYLAAGKVSAQYVLERTKRHVVIPYKCNRAVLFDSSHYHRTNSPYFDIARPEGMRMNITFSYACAEYVAEQIRLING